MKIERTQNASRNILFGTVLKVYQIAVPFCLRTAMIYLLGAQYLGLNSLFTSILQVLNLAELGVGNAMVYSMYKPIAEDDTKTICALMRLYRTYYRAIGLVIAVIGVTLLPWLPVLVEGEIPADMNLRVLYLLNLAATVFSYWLFAYKNCLLTAHQRTDVNSKIMLGVNTLQYGMQFLVLFFFRSYYLYLIVTLAAQILTNIVTSLVVGKMYPYYMAGGTLDKEITKSINRRIRDLFTSKLGAVIINSADTIVISAFLGLTILAVYQNYFFILTAILGLVDIVFHACIAGIGNSIIVESKEKVYRDFCKFTFIIVWIVGFCACCLLCLYQPFMELWVGRKMMLSISAVVCLCGYYFILELNQLLCTYKDAAGLWHKDRFRPLVTALSNLFMNLVMVQFWGIYGVLFSTVLSVLLVGMPWLLHNLFTVLFDKAKLGHYLKKMGVYVGTVVAACGITYRICGLLPVSGWCSLILRGIFCCIIPNAVFYTCFHKYEEFSQSVILVDTMTKGKLSFVLRRFI